MAMGEPLFPMTIELSFAIALWAELFFYGIYITLLGSAFWVLVKETGRHSRRTSALVYLWTTIAMFIVATLHLGVSHYRFIRAYILMVDPLGGDSYIFDLPRADSFFDSSLFCIMTWLGDALVIYRCYYVWNRKCWIIVAPVLMLIASIVLNIVILVWYAHGPEFPELPGARFRYLTLPMGLVYSIFPLGVAQNVITTGLIALKIWRQHQISTAHGIVDRSSSLSLFRIMRIIIESALIYTLQNIALTVLFYIQHPAQYIVQHVMVPSVGIVFILISVRVHMARSNSVMRAGFNTFLQDDDESVIEFHTNRSLPPGVVSLPIPSDSRRGTDDFGESKEFSNPSYNLQNLKARTNSISS